MRMVVMRDDLDNGLSADETIEFALDGWIYVIDLTTVNAKQLREDFHPYITAAHDKRKLRERDTSLSAKAVLAMPLAATTTSPKKRKHRSDPEKNRIRQWARDNGLRSNNGGPIRDSARLSQRIIDAYYEAHPEEKPE